MTYKKMTFSFLTVFLLLFGCFATLFPIKAATPVIVINPGHLVGRDSGAVNNNTKIKEADLNAALAAKTAEKLKSIGYEVYLTHPVNGCSIPALLTTQQVNEGYDSDSSLKTIGDAINAKNPDLAISLHHNSGGSASGYEFYWSSYRAGIDNSGVYKKYGLWGNGDYAWLDETPCESAVRSKEFTGLLEKNFSGIGIPFRNTIERDDYIPAHTTCPSVLIEAGFVSNDNESRKLADESYQNNEATRIVKSINDFFGYKPNATVQEISFSNVKNNTFDIIIKGLKSPYDLSGITVPVWSEVNGQDDIKWYWAERQWNGDYKVTVNIKDHGNDTGTYNVHAYAVDTTGNFQVLKTASVTVPEANPGKITAEELNVSEVKNGQFTATISKVNVPNGMGLSGITVPVWSEVNGQDDIKWYWAERQWNGDYKVTVNIKDHGNDTGTYNVHAYAVDTTGNFQMLKTIEIEVPEENNAAGLTSIIGNSAVRVEQLVYLYNSSGHDFPSYYTENGRNVDLNRFAQLYIEEANAEGIRADVAFAQAMKETGWLKFGGQVSISQFNFAGLGATDDGAAGMSFAQKYGDNENGIRMGIRAQIQHLKAYASTEPLNNACVDERFNLVKRGCAPYVEWLGQKENPNGYGWATGANYGQGIIDIMNRIP